MKRVLSVFLAIVTVLCVLTVFAGAAYANGSYTVNTRSGVNVRSGPGTNYSIVGASTNGTSFSVSYTSGSWGYTSSIQTTSGRKAGWVCLNYCRFNGSGAESYRDTYNDVFASVRGYGYQLSQARKTEANTFTKGTFVYVWGFLHDKNDNLYKTYGSGTCNMKLSIYRPNGSCAFSYTYENCDCNWIGQELDEAGTWKIQSEISGALYGNNTASIYVTNPAPSRVDPTGISLNYSSITLSKGSSKQLSATVYPSNASNRSVSWSSKDSSVASVSGGFVYGRKPGVTTVTAKTSNGKTASCTVYVKGITISPYSAAYINVGDTYYLSTSSYGVSSSRKWTSSNSSVLSVNSYGTITAKKAGTATITVKTSDGYSDSITYTVHGTTLNKSVSFSSNSYVTVKLNMNCGAGYVKIFTYDLYGWKTDAKIHVTLRDTNGRWIWEGDTTSGSRLKLGSDHSAYRIYVRPASYPNTIQGQSDSFINNGKCSTWMAQCTSGAYII